MVIHDRGYSRWKGSRELTTSPIPVILGAGIRRGGATIFRRKIPALALTLVAYGPFLAALAIVYLRAYVLGRAEEYGHFAEVLAEPEFADLFAANAENVFSYMFLFQWPFVLIACVLLGAGLVAEDRRANALELYLARPVTPRQYLLGKFAVIGTFIASVTVVPATILILAMMSLAWGEPGEAGRLLVLLARTIAAGALWVAIPSMLILTASSLASRARNAAILWLAVVLMLEFVVSKILEEIFGNPSFGLLGVGFNVMQLGAWILGDAADLDARVPVWQSALVLAAWIALCVTTMLRRVKPVEVVA